MQKLLKYILHISVLFFFNVTTLYTGTVHNHQFSWTYQESCPVFILSVTLNSDTYTFDINTNTNPTDEDIFNFQSSNSNLSFEIKNDYLSRAPPFL